MELPSVAPLRPTQPETTSEDSPAEPHIRLSRVAPLPPSSRPERILDFDVETIAAGFADPQWVPQKITCVAWSWIGEDVVHVRACGPLGLFGQTELRGEMLEPLLEAIGGADMLTGHNLLRFDLPIINSECIRLRLPPLKKSLLVQDTMRILKTKGLKKGQDHWGDFLRTKERKKSLNWQGWQDAYDEPDWATVKERAVSDVLMHKEIRLRMIEEGWIKSPVRWRP